MSGAINEGHTSGSALLILKGHKDFGAQPKCLEQKVDIEAKHEICRFLLMISYDMQNCHDNNISRLNQACKK